MMGKVKLKDKLNSYFTRCGQETPPFFKKLRMAGMIIAAAGTAVLASPIALPAVVTSVAGYLIVGGSVATAVSQAAVTDDQSCKPPEVK